jgi:hypothetical protein
MNISELLSLLEKNGLIVHIFLTFLEERKKCESLCVLGA